MRDSCVRRNHQSLNRDSAPRARRAVGDLATAPQYSIRQRRRWRLMGPDWAIVSPNAPTHQRYQQLARVYRARPSPPDPLKGWGNPGLPDVALRPHSGAFPHRGDGQQVPAGPSRSRIEISRPSAYRQTMPGSPSRVREGAGGEVQCRRGYSLAGSGRVVRRKGLWYNRRWRGAIHANWPRHRSGPASHQPGVTSSGRVEEWQVARCSR